MMNNHKEEFRVAGIAVGVYIAFSLAGALGRKIGKALDKVAEELNAMAQNVKDSGALNVEEAPATGTGTADNTASNTTHDNVVDLKKDEKPSDE